MGVVVVDREELTVEEWVGATVREGLEKGEKVPTGTTAPANGTTAGLGPGPDTLSQSAPLRQRPEQVGVVSSVAFP